jgi:starch phosphorylase
VAVTATSYEELRDVDTPTYRVTAQVSLGDLDPSDVDVQLLHGAVELDDELREPSITSMSESGEGAHPGWRRYSADLSFKRAGNVGFTVRIVPSHPDLRTFAYLGKVAWAPHTGGLSD